VVLHLLVHCLFAVVVATLGLPLMFRFTIRELVALYLSLLIVNQSGCGHSASDPSASLASMEESRLSEFSVRATRSGEEYVMEDRDVEYARQIIRSLLPVKRLETGDRPNQSDYAMHVHCGKNSIDIPISVRDKSVVFVFDGIVCEGGSSVEFKSTLAAAMKLKRPKPER